MKTIIGVDVGGTWLRAARYDIDLKPQAHARNTSYPEKGKKPEGEEAARIVFERLVATIRTVIPERKEDVLGIGVVLPGPVDAKTGILIAPPNLPFRNAPIRQMLQDALDIPVFIGNDADLAGLAEHQHGAGAGSDVMIYITVSTGVGSGIIIHGEPFSGRGQGGEAGHIVVAPDGPMCSCGRQGHLEAVAAGSGMERIVKNRIAAGESSSILDLAGGDPVEIKAEMITRAAQQGDALGLEIITQAGRYLGIAIASLMVLFNPDKFVLGGGVTDAGDLLLKPMHAAIQKYAMNKLYWENTPIVMAKLDKDVGLIGAASLVKLRQMQGVRNEG